MNEFETLRAELREAKDELWNLRRRAGCGPDQEGPDIWQREAALRSLLADILEANEEFRNQLPVGWEGDPLDDACQAARAALSSGQGTER